MTDKKTKYILVIDLGTSGPKSTIISTNGEVVDSEFMDVPLYLFLAAAPSRTPATGGTPS